MRGLKIAAGLVLLASAAGLAAQQWPRSADDLVVHEWGTFLAMSGSDGVALDGMYHEEHALPAFVHARSRDQLRLPSVVLKGETPVIYFYTDRAQKVRVDVRFPTGLWTQWFPQAQIVGPQFSQARSPLALRDGRIRWCAEIVPGDSVAPQPPATSVDAFWNFARDVDAAYVRTNDGTKESNPAEAERFLFYRGLGTVPLPLRLTAESNGTLESSQDDRHGARHVFIVRVEGGKGTYLYRPAISPGGRLTGLIPPMDGAKPLAEFTEALGRDLQRRLVESGLFPKEAAAMVNTWRTSYFQTEGVRALFVMPQAWTDEFIPLTVTPEPAKTVRVMVGRIELLTADRERRAEEAIGALASSDVEARDGAFAFLREQGRYVEPIVRRVLATTGDEPVKRLSRQLLATDFVTELRAAIHDAADGSRVQDDPVHIRAQLASLLREIGLDAEAKAEGEKVVAALKSRPAPPLSDPDSRQYLRAYARALEGIGDARGAADWYGRFIRFGSQVGSVKDCRACHRDAGPLDMDWFRDWWAGRRYATYAARGVGLEKAIADRRAATEKAPRDAASRMMLAYLLEAKGDHDGANAQWAKLGGTTSPRTIVSKPAIRRASLTSPPRPVPSERPAFIPAPGSPIKVGPMAGKPAVGDMNADGRPDIVAPCGACCGTPHHPESGHVGVFLGDGKGGFVPAGTPDPVGPTVHKVVLGDVDEDGDLDALAIEHDSYGITVLLGDGRGGLRPASGSPVTAGRGRRAHTHDVALGDTNGDGHLDAVATLADDRAAAVLLGDGKGGFRPAKGSPFPAGRHPYEGLSLGDLDGDRRPDLVVADMHGHAAIALRGDGTGAFVPAPGSPFRAGVGPRPGYLAVGDLNGDSRPDIVATHDDDPLLAVLLGDGRGGFAAATGSPLKMAGRAWGVSLGDLDGDGRLDAALAGHDAGIMILLGDGKGGLSPRPGSPLSAGQGTQYVVPADLNRDGRMDLIAANYRSGDLTILLGAAGDE